jgi:CMP-N,N'-diacetyllegionaminic acid synthase
MRLYMKVVALIPARGGSKGIIDKNIKHFCGKPLIYYSIEIAKKSKYISDVVVTTDSLAISDVALQCGVSVPFLRPSELAQDNSPDIDFFNHYLKWLKDHNKDIPELIVHLRPTYPIRDVQFLDNCIDKFIQNYDKYDSLRTVIENTDKSPYKMYTVEDNKLSPVVPASQFPFAKEPFNMCRQILPKTFTHNGCIDIVKSSVILEKNILSGYNIFPVIMDSAEKNDIDTMDDWKIAEKRYY